MIDCARRYGPFDCFSSYASFKQGFRVWEAGDPSIVLVGFVGAVLRFLFEAFEDLLEEAVGLTAVASLAFVLGAGEVLEEAEAFGVGGDDFDEAAVGGGRAAMLKGVHVAPGSTGAGAATTSWHDTSVGKHAVTSNGSSAPFRGYTGRNAGMGVKRCR